MNNDLTGVRFGNLTVLKKIEERTESGHIQWLCRCDCGNEVIKTGARLRAKKARSCGCLKKTNLVGERFGRLEVIEKVETNERSENKWLCKCDCGNETFATTHSLKSGNKKSCGCIKSEMLAERNKANTKHGMSHTKLHGVWHNMKDRCYRRECEEYKRYGMRGIKVCEEWKNNFQSFYLWSIENGYKNGLTLDRKNVNGDYTPENCRWATEKEQANNRRNNKFLTNNGETKTMKQWSEEVGIPYYIVKNRVKAGLPVGKILYKGDLRKFRK